MDTPFFPEFRSRLAALGRRTHSLRQATLAQLQEHLRGFLPAPLLSAEDQGPNSRDRIFTLRLTFECFIWQLLKPKTSCREVVRQVQALFRLHGQGPVDEGDSACVQARLRLPQERLEKALIATAQAADRRAGRAGQLQGRPVKVVATPTVGPSQTGLYPAQALAGLYLRRWRIELSLRDLKTTMGMEQLRCKTPDMAEKELLAYLVAHNLIRCVIAEAVARYSMDLERVSFKGSVDALRQYSNALVPARNRKMRRQLWEDLLLNLVRDLVRYRPNRTEPRAVKRRPKPYPLLHQPRRRFVEISHRSRYWKGRPRNYRSLN
jgi:hypothetical protein